MKKFDYFFLKVHLLIEENRSEAVSERFRQFKGKKTKNQKRLELKKARGHQKGHFPAVKKNRCYILIYEFV